MYTHTYEHAYSDYEFPGILFIVKVPNHHHITETEYKRQVYKCFSVPDWILSVKHREWNLLMLQKTSS